MASVGSPTQPGAGQAQHLADHAKLKAFLDGHGGDDPAHTAAGVTVNPSGLAVVTTTDVQAALAQLDGRSAGSYVMRGTWATGATYAVNDVVQSASGSSWVALRAHTAGATFPGATGAPPSWRLLGAGAMSDLLDTSISAPANGDVPMWNAAAGRFVNSSILTPNGEIARSVNESGTPSGDSTTPAGGGQGSQITIASVSVTVIAGQTRPVYFSACTFAVRDAVATAGTFTLVIAETTSASVLANAPGGALPSTSWLFTAPLPTYASGTFSIAVPAALCRLDPAQTTVDRIWGLGFYTNSPTAGIKAHALNLAPVAGSGTNTHLGSVLLAERK